MLKKVACVYAVIIGISASSAMAVPTIRKVGNTAPAANNNSLAVTSRAAKMPLSTNNRIPIIKQAVQNIKVGGGKTNTGIVPTPSSTTPSSGAGSMSEISERVTAIEEQTTNIVNNVTEDLTEVTDRVSTVEEQTNSVVEDLTGIKDRLSAVESQTDNILTGVESQTGNYVTSVAINGNKIQVNKTSSLLAPVRNGEEETTGNAEIWIVR